MEPMFHNSIEDVHLLFEVKPKSFLKNTADKILVWTLTLSFSLLHLLFTLQILLAGVQFEDNGEFSVRDAELASLRKTRNLKVICEEIIPRNHTDILQLIYSLSNQNGPLEQEDFERTLMTMVYTTQQMVDTAGEHQRGVWEESFVNLYKAIKQDLTETG